MVADWQSLQRLIEKINIIRDFWCFIIRDQVATVSQPQRNFHDLLLFLLDKFA